MNRNFDVIVVGGGHAGIEAAHAAATMGCKTALISFSKNTIGLMPCNPAIGGVGKGHIVFEVSALGGLMPQLCRDTYLQVRMLNTKKGPAVQGLRLQIDKEAYKKHSLLSLEQKENISIIEGEVEEIIIENRIVIGCRVNGKQFNAPNVILTSGTFLRGLTHIGTECKKEEGRQGEPAAYSLSNNLKLLGLKLGRLKTGTPPRLLRSSLDLSQMEPQDDMELDYLFEFHPHCAKSSHSCYITHTNKNTHEIIRKNFSRSPIFAGIIHSRGPRYCPSIEDKIFRFSDKESHHVFVEPESASSDEIYPNGLSTALPLDVQEEYIHSIKGFEHAIITKPGYAVEYDFVLPTQLHHTLEVKNIAGLFCAGQINGTTGYEEAAGQGIIAGINAACKILKKEPFKLERHESYIGVMIDDLVTMGVDEPYRMFTSRAERRLMLRQDNVFLRLTDKAYAIGMIDQKLYDDFSAERKLLRESLSLLRKKYRPQELSKLIGKPECPRAKIIELVDQNLSERIIKNIHAEILYEPYLARELREIERNKQFEELKIKETIDYQSIDGLSNELKQKLISYKPATIAQASRIPGMTPAAISLLIFRTRRIS